MAACSWSAVFVTCLLLYAAQHCNTALLLWRSASSFLPRIATQRNLACCRSESLFLLVVCAALQHSISRFECLIFLWSEQHYNTAFRALNVWFFLWSAQLRSITTQNSALWMSYFSCGLRSCAALQHRIPRSECLIFLVVCAALQHSNSCSECLIFLVVCAAAQH